MCAAGCGPGYIQGMSDLASPFIAVMEDEVSAFWCFVGFMHARVRCPRRQRRSRWQGPGRWPLTASRTAWARCVRGAGAR